MAGNLLKVTHILQDFNKHSTRQHWFKNSHLYIRFNILTDNSSNHNDRYINIKIIIIYFITHLTPLPPPPPGQWTQTYSYICLKFDGNYFEGKIGLQDFLVSNYIFLSQMLDTFWIDLVILPKILVLKIKNRNKIDVLLTFTSFD